ncbi:MAG: DUF1343 domain-containing protein [Bacteroidales bacterium]|nr:DUF1343 domain-containing protein [Bacteroidales bacterium]
MNRFLHVIRLVGMTGVATFFAAACAQAQTAPVMTGIEVLEEYKFEQLLGKRVGLVTNPSGVDRNLRSTIDILFESPEVNLVALFGPEHGVRGDAYAGDNVDGGLDPKTGLPVYSLYGPTREPTPEMLKGIDVMVYDIQDVGTRCYTFISTLGLVMRACAKAGIEVMVLDRPNPLGGLKVEGPLVEDGFHSFVSEFKIPFVYGLTVGELAGLINEEGLNRGQNGKEEHLKCRLTVIPMHGWRRDMLYEDTRLPWVLPSPNIPSVHSAICYPAAGIGGEFGHLNIGVGYTIPFQTFAAEWIDADSLKARLDSYHIPGTAFRTIHYKPMSGSLAGKLVHGVEFFFTDYDSATVTLTQFYVIQAVQELYPDHNPFPMKKTRMLDIVCGTDYVRTTFEKRLRVEDIVDFWNKDARDFKTLSQKYHLYR